MVGFLVPAFNICETTECLRHFCIVFSDGICSYIGSDQVHWELERKGGNNQSQRLLLPISEVFLVVPVTNSIIPRDTHQHMT